MCLNEDLMSHEYAASTPVVCGGFFRWKQFAFFPPFGNLSDPTTTFDFDQSSFIIIIIIIHHANNNDTENPKGGCYQPY